MLFSSSIAAFALLITPAFAVPTALKTVAKYDGEVNVNSYIVKYKNGVSASSRAGARTGTGVTVTQEYTTVFNGFAADLSNDALTALRGDSNIESIEEDGIVHTAARVTQTNAPWGLSRISRNGTTGGSPSDLEFDYTCDSSAGEGVDVYVVDTGVNANHIEFTGRARFGFAVSPYALFDGDGHGTHCAGTIAAASYGVAKRASIIGVKVLSDTGSGSISRVISGFDYIIKEAAASGRPSIASISISGGVSLALDSAIESLTAAGIHAIVAAGNSNVDAANTSPARAPSAITVGSSDIKDVRAFDSNFGAVVDVFAPGTDIISTWIGSNTATQSLSGTSMAAPHVAGLAAYFIKLYGNKSPAELSTYIKSLALKGVLTDIPAGTANLLVKNEV